MEIYCIKNIIIDILTCLKANDSCGYAGGSCFTDPANAGVSTSTSPVPPDVSILYQMQECLTTKKEAIQPLPKESGFLARKDKNQYWRLY